MRSTNWIGLRRSGLPDTKQDPAKVRQQIEDMLQEKAFAPLGGLAGEKMINVLEVNLELRKRFGAPA